MKIAAMQLSCIPAKSLVDEIISIKIQGLIPREKVTLTSYVTEGNMKYGAYAHYIASDQGVVDATTMPSVGGLYEGVEAMGLFWSMEPCPGQRKGLRLVKKDVTKPFITKIAVISGHQNEEFIYSSEKQELASTIIERSYMSPSVKRSRVKEGRIRGTLFVPNGTGPFPGIIDMYGGTGGPSEGRAALLASKGYTVLHLAYFGEEPLPDTFTIDLEYFDEAFDFMNSLSSVQSDNIAMVGISMGGELSLLFASVSSRMKAVVAVSAVPYVTYNSHEYKGKLYPCIECDVDKIVIDEQGDYIFGNSVADKTPETRIKLENCTAPVLIIQGSEDVNTIPSADKDVAEIEKQHGPTTTKVVTYQGAGHLIEVPFGPFVASSYHRMMNASLIWGGEKVANSRAQEQSWQLIQQFLDKHLHKNVKHKL